MPKLNNPKQDKYVQELIKNGGKQRQAYMKVYPNATPLSAQDQSSRLMNKPEVIDRLGELMNKSGLGIKDNIEALKTLSNAEKWTTHQGVLIESVPDNTAQLEALKIAMKLNKIYDTGVQTDNRSLHIHLNEQDTSALKEITEKLTDLNKALNIEKGGQTGEIAEEAEYEPINT